MVHIIHLIFHFIFLYSTSICDIINHNSLKNSSYSFTQLARNVVLFTIYFIIFYVIHHHNLYYYYLYSICEINNFISIIIPHRSLFKLIIKNFKRIILSQSVNLLMISVTTPLLVTYVIAVVSIYMGSQELPPIRNNLNFCYLLFIFPK